MQYDLVPDVGAPVFENSRLVGLVASQLLDQLSSGFRVNGLVEILSVDAMAQSEVTPAVRNLIGHLETDSDAVKPFPASARDKKFSQGSVGVAQTNEVATQTNAQLRSVDLSDAELWARLSPSSRQALAHAEGIRLALRKNELHTEYLIAGLFPSWKGFFSRAGVGEQDLRKIVQREFTVDIPDAYRVPDLDRLPPLSRNVRQALLQAAKYADERGAKAIWSTHLLYGALSVRESITVRALNERGVRRENIRPSDGPDTDDGNDEIPTLVPAKTEANPTPKVASDLWCEADRLGYEAYARTIASLITHKETVAPLTIGIKAPWGAGKTSLMKRVQHLLDGYAELSEGSRIGILQELLAPKVTLRELLQELKGSSKPTKLKEKRSKEGEAYGLPRRTTVWFNAWKYQTSEQIWAGMAHCIISQVTARMDVKERELFWLRLHSRRINVDEVRKKVYEVVLRRLLPMAMLVLAVCAIAFWVAAVLPVGVPWRYVIRGVSMLWGATRMTKEWRKKLSQKAAGTMRELIREPDYEGKMGYLHLVESDIREVLQLATEASMTEEKPSGDPLVVFVDDLDRCAPNNVAEVVEAINLFLCGDYPNCIFVLGMEPGMVAAALEVANKEVIEKAEAMGLVDRAVPVGWRFMEKIVQLPIMIPPPTKAGRQKYVRSLTGLRAESVDVTFVAPSATPITAVPVPISRPEQYGPEEEKKVQSYLDKVGLAKNASEAAKRGLDVVAHAPVEDRWAAREAGNRIYEQSLTAEDPVMAQFLEDVAQLVDGNPRQIKRYVNVFRFYSTLRNSLRLEGVIPSGDLPSDQVLAKFVALSIQWPHAVDCLRVKKDLKTDGADGQKVTLLEFLETESKKVPGVGADSAWVKLVGKEGLGMGEWAQGRAFREFLSRGESLCGKEGHGLW